MIQKLMVKSLLSFNFNLNRIVVACDIQSFKVIIGKMKVTKVILSCNMVRLLAVWERKLNGFIIFSELK